MTRLFVLVILGVTISFLVASVFIYLDLSGYYLWLFGLLTGLFLVGLAEEIANE